MATPKKRTTARTRPLTDAEKDRVRKDWIALGKRVAERNQDVLEALD